MLERGRFIGPLIFLSAVAVAGIFLWELRAPAVPAARPFFTVAPGEGFLNIMDRLESEGFVRSRTVMKALGALTGAAVRVKAGTFALSPGESAPRVLWTLVGGGAQQVEVRIPEGASLYDVDAILAAHGVVPLGALIALARATTTPFEGMLFPDTYLFFLGSDPQDVVTRMTDAFRVKAAPLLAADPVHATEDLILASLIEKEVSGDGDRATVAGILKKRVAAHMPLQVDATVCYAKEIAASRSVPCIPITALDLRRESPYNTYLHKGWPPGPIGSVGVSAIDAALHPKSSPYWFYLSDPVTKQTIFSKTLEEHNLNRSKYLK